MKLFSQNLQTKAAGDRLAEIMQPANLDLAKSLARTKFSFIKPQVIYNSDDNVIRIIIPPVNIKGVHSIEVVNEPRGGDFDINSFGSDFRVDLGSSQTSKQFRTSREANFYARVLSEVDAILTRLEDYRTDGRAVIKANKEELTSLLKGTGFGFKDLFLQVPKV